MHITRVQTNPGIICFPTYRAKMCEQWSFTKQFLCADVTGERFDLSINECASNPCNNGATCLDYVNDFTCFCQPGWTGKTCNVDINECSSNPCKNEGQCVNELNGYSCKCNIAFRGPNCEIDIDDCANPNLCQNGATCYDGLASYTCSCASGFSGKQCEINIDDCQSLPCQHHGTCYDGINSYSCICAPGYIGKNCSVNLTNAPAIRVCLVGPARINKMGFSADVLQAQVVSCQKIDLYGQYFMSNCLLQC